MNAMMSRQLFLLTFTLILLFFNRFIQTSPVVDDDLVKKELEPPRLWGEGFSQRKCALLKNKHFSDVDLIAMDQNADGMAEIIDAIPAHKLILQLASPVFENAFNSLNTFVSTLHIERISLETLDILLRYIYCDHVDIANEKLLDVLFAAKTYEMHDLTDYVVKRVVNRLTAENVFYIYEQINQFHDPRIDKAISIMIQNKAGSLLNKKQMETLSRSTVEFILRQPKLMISETRLFELLLHWARKQAANQQGIDYPSAEMLRKSMGNLLYLIRIPSIESKLFLKTIAKSKILMPKEILDIVNYQSLNSKPQVGIVSKFDLKSRHFRRSKIQTPLWTGYSDGFVVRTTNQVRLSFKSDFNFCLQQVKIISREVSKFVFSVLNETGNELVSFENDAINETRESLYLVKLDDCIFMDANNVYTLMLKFDNIKLSHYQLYDRSEKYVEKNELGSIVYESDEEVPMTIQFDELEMLV